MSFWLDAEKTHSSLKSIHLRVFSSEAWLELTTIVQLTELKILRVCDVFVRGQEQNDVTLLVLYRNNVK